MRINKLFSNFGICSRRETNKLIEEGRIKVNGEYCVLGQWINENDEVLLDDIPVKEMEKVYIAFNKPKGITCTLDKSDINNIGEYLNYSQYIFPVGRLDKESEGLIILTNDGDFSNLILESDNEHDKEYIVKLNKPFDDEFLEKMKNGVEISAKGGSGVKRISDTEGIIIKNGKRQTVILTEMNSEKIKGNTIKTKPCKVERVDDYTFKIILTQGLNRQIRKMSSSLGYNVVNLKRIRIMNIHLGDLEIGKYRMLSKNQIQEIIELKHKNV